MSTLFRDFMENESLREISKGNVAELARSVDKLNDMIDSAHKTFLEVGPVDNANATNIPEKKIPDFRQRG